MRDRCNYAKGWAIGVVVCYDWGSMMRCFVDDLSNYTLPNTGLAPEPALLLATHVEIPVWTQSQHCFSLDPEPALLLATRVEMNVCGRLTRTSLRIDKGQGERCQRYQPQRWAKHTSLANDDSECRCYGMLISGSG